MVNELPNATSRNWNADFLKALSIFGVVLIHVSTTFVEQIASIIFMQSLFSFCVPVFITLNAYFIASSKRQAISWKRSFTRAIKLFKTFLVWSLIYFLLSADWDQLTIRKVFTKHFSGFGWAGQYFLVVLIQVTIFLPVIQNLLRSKRLSRILIALTVLIYLFYSYFFTYTPNFVDSLSHRLFIYWLIYPYIGIVLATSKSFKFPKWCILSVLLIPIENYILTTHVSVNLSPYIRLSVLLSSYILCTFIVNQPPKVLCSTKWVDALVNILAKNTMSIYLLNPLVIILLNLLMADSRVPELLIVPATLAYTLIVLFVCIVTAAIFKFTKIDAILCMR